MIIKGENIHDLLSASWRPRKAGSVVLVQTLKTENQGSQGIKPSPSLKVQEPGGQRAGEDGCSDLSTEQIHASFAFLFYQALNGSDDAQLYWWEWSSLLS